MKAWACGEAKRSNILALFTLTGLELMCLAKRFIVPDIHLFINQYSKLLLTIRTSYISNQNTPSRNIKKLVKH